MEDDLTQKKMKTRGCLIKRKNIVLATRLDHKKKTPKQFNKLRKKLQSYQKKF